MGKKNVVLTVVEPKAKREPKYSVLTVKTAVGLTFDVAGMIRAGVAALDSTMPVNVKTLKSGRVTLTIGKVTVGAPKMTPEQKTAVSQYRRLVRNDPKTAALVSKLSENGAAISDEKRAQILALLAS